MFNLIVIEVLETTSSTIIGEVHLQKCKRFKSVEFQRVIDHVLLNCNKSRNRNSKYHAFE